MGKGSGKGFGSWRLMFQEDAKIAEYLKQYGEQLGTQREGLTRHRISTILARDNLLLGQIQEATAAIFRKIPAAAPAGWALKDHHEKTARHLNLVLSDLHLGAALNGREVPLEYGSIESSRRLSKVILDTVEFKVQYRPETILNVHILGDIIQNQLHDARDGNPLAEQVAEAQYLLCRAIHFLSQHFPEVHVRCTPGNHGRNTARHQERATIQKWDATEVHVYHCIKMYCQHLKNVTVEIPRTPYISCKSFEHRMFFTHGDTVINVGNPMKSLNVEGLIRQTNEINASCERASERYSLFGAGHVHFASVMRLPTGPWFLTNPALIPTDNFAVSLGHLTSACGQWLFESVPAHVMGHHFISVVDKHVDKDKSLDRLIKPFGGF